MVEDSALCLVFCSTLSALVSVMPVLCSLVLHLTRLGVMGTPWQFAFNKTPPARPNLGFTIRLRTTIYLPLGSADSRVIFILNPPGSVLLWVLVRNGQPAGPPWGNSRVGFTHSLTYQVCPENQIRATPIGICRHIGRLCWSCFTIVEMSCNCDSETDRVFPGEGISLLTVRACDGLSWDTPVGFWTFESRARGYGQMGIC